MKSQSDLLLVLKRFLLLFLPVLALISSIALLFYYTKIETINNERFFFETNEVDHVNRQLQIIINNFNSVKSDLAILSGDNEMQDLFKTGDERCKKAVAEEYLVFCSARGIYDQVRFLNEKGMEVVRVNYNTGNPYIVPENQLQFKGDLYYFKDTFTQNNEGEIFVSTFDLNIERGKIEKPLKPIIRFGVTAFDSSGQKRGIIIVNYLGKVLINKIKLASNKIPGSIMLLNSNGYWLYSIKPEDEWGFMYEDRKAIAFGNTFPEAWQQISADHTGQFYNDDGLFTYTTVYPLQKELQSTTDSGNAEEYTWKIVSYVGSDVLNAKLSYFMIILFSIYGSVIVLLGCGSWFLSSSGVRRRNAEERITSLAHILEESLNEIYIFDANTLRFIMVNEGARRNLGYSMEELNNLTPLDIKPEFTAELFAKTIEPLRVAEKKRIELETVHLRKDGSVYNVKIFLQLSKLQSTPVFVAIILDITEHKKMEETLLQTEKLKSIGTITAGISHEFNNLLAIISGNVQLLEGAYEDDSVLTGALRTIMSAADDGAEIASNMLKFTKTTQDTIALVSSDIRDMIMQSIDFTKPKWNNEAQARGINYKMDTESMKKTPFIMCKHTEIREIFINIINNSLDAMPEGGSISFSTWSGDDMVFVTATDTGVGMSENVKKNVFDPFFSTKGVEGTGLGMSMVYGIVTRHGGKIYVDSEIGKGTTFTLQFPVTNKRRSPIETPGTEQKASINGLRILVVDDEEAMRNILEQLLSRSGHNVKTVDNGADAINMVEGEGFDLVLCDLAMPNVFGYDVVKVLNGLKKRPKIGIITGWSEYDVSNKDIKVDFYLKKPFKHSELAKHINELFTEDSK
jgi:PAS domain S-box-containing protein